MPHRPDLALRATIALALALSGPAEAQLTPAAEAEAREHYQKGSTYYDLSKWDEAVEEFTKAYELSHAPGLLFNIAQAYRLKGDTRRALQTYKTYLRLDPKAANRSAVEERIAELEKEVERGTAPPTEPPPLPPASQPASAPASRPSSQVMRVDANVMRVEVKGQPRSQTMLRAGLLTAGAGVVVIGVGTYFAVKARSEWNDVEVTVDQDGPWRHPDTVTWDDAESHERTAKILFVIGGATLITGGVLYFFGAQAASDDGGLSLAPVPGGGVVSARGSF